MIRFLDLYGQYLTIKPEIDEAMSKVLRESAFIGGEAVRAFEVDFAAFLGAEHCVGVGNGTDAIEIVLEALDLPPGSEVLVPANSFIASSEAVTRAGHKPVFCDVDAATYTIDPEGIESRINQRTRAVIAVHLYGQPSEMSAIDEVARRFSLHVIEDCAQASGARYLARRVGTIGRAGTFSFYPGKNLGAYGDAGAIVTQDPVLAARCRKIANHGRVGKYDHEFEGRNSRLDGLQAAVLSVKLKRLDSWNARRREIAELYGDGLRGVGDLVLPRERADTNHVFHLYVIRTAHREALIEYLRNRDIECGVHYPTALPDLRAYCSQQSEWKTPRASRYAAEVMSLPIGEHLTDAMVAEVVRGVRSYFAEAQGALAGE